MYTPPQPHPSGVALLSIRRSTRKNMNFKNKGGANLQFEFYQSYHRLEKGVARLLPTDLAS